MHRSNIVLTFAVIIAAGCSQQGLPASPSITNVPGAAASQRLRDAATYKNLYSFQGNPDGGSPVGEFASLDGKLYGATMHGGNNHNGTVYSIPPDGKESVVYSFPGGADGALPEGGLWTAKGKLFGTTRARGLHDAGTVFVIDPKSGQRLAYSFKNAPDGDAPVGDLWGFPNDAVIYGTTSFGGEDNVGTVYYSDPSKNFEDVIYNFKMKRDGARPLAGLVLMNTTLYGTTADGGAYGFGTVYAIEIGGRERVVHDFRGPPSDGAAPQSQLAVMDGKLYGTTPHGGGANGGTLFMVTPNGAEQLLVNFKRASGSAPVAGVTVYNKTLYGTTSRGGSADAGTIFAFSSGALTTLHTFKAGADGREPLSRLTAFNGVLYGTTYLGGTEGRGTVFALTP
jgi:uncharacterized repeat protein (TIGR03803 family)